jgi:hypothetical protein
MSRRGGGLPANASGVEPHRASISSRFGLQVCGGGCARTRARHVPRYVMSTVFRVAGRGGGEVGGWGGGGNCRAPPTSGGGRGRARSLSGHVCAPPDGFGCPGAQLHRRALLSRLRACEGRGLPVDLPVRFFFFFFFSQWPSAIGWDDPRARNCRCLVTSVGMRTVTTTLNNNRQRLRAATHLHSLPVQPLPRLAQPLLCRVGQQLQPRHLLRREPNRCLIDAPCPPLSSHGASIRQPLVVWGAWGISIWESVHID